MIIKVKMRKLKKTTQQNLILKMTFHEEDEVLESETMRDKVDLVKKLLINGQMTILKEIRKLLSEEVEDKERIIEAHQKIKHFKEEAHAYKKPKNLITPSKSNHKKYKNSKTHMAEEKLKENKNNQISNLKLKNLQESKDML